MKITLLILSVVIFIFSKCEVKENRQVKVAPTCTCDTVKAKTLITTPGFLQFPVYHDSVYNPEQFYALDTAKNKMLWYRDVENPFPTRLTMLWNDYAPDNYHASHRDFVDVYNGAKDIELAFQLGPNSDLWAYHIFVVRKMDCCFLITRSYFRHARFTYKAYSLIKPGDLDSLFTILQKLPETPISKPDDFSYEGFFVNNRNHNVFRVDLENEQINDSTRKTEIKELYDFIDDKIKWKITYPSE